MQPRDVVSIDEESARVENTGQLTTDERRVETEFGRQGGDRGVREGLRDDDETDGDTGNEVSDDPLRCARVVENPVCEREQRLDIAADTAGSRTSGVLDRACTSSGDMVSIRVAVKRRGEKSGDSREVEAVCETTGSCPIQSRKPCWYLDIVRYEWAQ